MDISVIIPAYRASKTIARAVDSVLRQTLQASEIIIVADDEADYASALKDEGIASSSLKFLSTGATSTGAGNTRNIGIAAASGECIALLDADDAFHP